METRLEMRLRSGPFPPRSKGVRLSPCPQLWDHPCLDPLKTLLIPKDPRSRACPSSQALHPLSSSPCHSAHLQALAPATQHRRTPPRATPPLGSPSISSDMPPPARPDSPARQPLRGPHSTGEGASQRTWPRHRAGPGSLDFPSCWLPGRYPHRQTLGPGPPLLCPSPWKGRPGLWLTSWRKWTRGGRRTSEQL